jgi:hypothetical protein
LLLRDFNVGTSTEAGKLVSSECSYGPDPMRAASNLIDLGANVIAGLKSRPVTARVCQHDGRTTPSRDGNGDDAQRDDARPTAAAEAPHSEDRDEPAGYPARPRGARQGSNVLDVRQDDLETTLPGPLQSIACGRSWRRGRDSNPR